MNRTQTAVATVSLAALALAARVGADPVAFTQTPLSNAVAQLDRQYGIHIVLKGSLAQTPGKLVSFSVGDPATRLQVINALANAAGVDFQKGYVISKAAAGVAPPAVDVDSNGYVVFKSTTVSAVDAINAVATTDSATVQISPDVTGNVVLSATTLRTADAAREIARQTHTTWRTYYALSPLGAGGGGRVVDHTNSGQPITQDSFTYYGTKSRPQPATTATAAGTNGGPQQDASNPQGGPNGNYNYNSPLGYGYNSPYMNGGDPYANPYFSFNTGPAYGPNGGLYNQTTGGLGFGGFSGNGITVLPGSGGYGPFGGYGGSPVTISGFGGF